jgi:predicted short-subunit dehydrogenase-like oxidoreductase (DUF2520 family)
MQDREGPVAVCDHGSRAVQNWRRRIESHRREALTTLMDSSLFNLSRLGFPEGLTGPVSRGDDAAIQRHLCELQGPARDLYGGMTALLQTMLKDESEG